MEELIILISLKLDKLTLTREKMNSCFEKQPQMTSEEKKCAFWGSSQCHLCRDWTFYWKFDVYHTKILHLWPAIFGKAGMILTLLKFWWVKIIPAFSKYSNILVWYMSNSKSTSEPEILSFHSRANFQLVFFYLELQNQ